MVVAGRLVRRLAAGLAVTALAACSATPSGTRPGGELSIVSSDDDPRILQVSFDTVLYRHDEDHGTTIMLTDVPPPLLLAGELEDGQVTHMELLWVPRAGSTPIDLAATNLSIRHVVFARGEVGIYGGAGFAMPRGTPGDDTLSLDIRQGVVQLLESTPGFVDLLSPARVQGRITARLDSEQTRRMHMSLSQIVTNAFGRSMIVQRTGAASLRGSPGNSPHPQLCISLIFTRR
jgi:hypothetical protein